MLKALQIVKQLVKVLFFIIIFSLLIRLVFSFGNFHFASIKTFQDILFVITNILAMPFGLIKMVLPFIPSSFKIGPGYFEPYVFTAFIVYLILQIVIDFNIAKLIRKEEIKVELQEKQKQRKNIYINKDWKD